jgi:flagellar basal-body rod protein FlgB
MAALKQPGITEGFRRGLTFLKADPRHDPHMEQTQIGLFDLAEQRLDWVDRRQVLLSQNIANASTPGFEAKDLTPFAQALAQASPEMARTNARHLTPPGGAGVSTRQRPHERAPDGNAVSLEEELEKVSDTQGTQALVTNLYQKYMGMFRTALGK